MPDLTVPRCYDIERAAAALPPDASRLKVVGYSLAAVASLPRRLANPPPKHPMLDLGDVLEDRHCSPISLVDFEHYLAYTEHNVENLYFMLWLRAYTAEHANLEHSDPSTVARVSDSATIAARTYIETDAPYQVNLTHCNRTALLALSMSPPPPPSAYDAARREVHLLLEDSLRRWEKCAKSNAGWRRLAFSTYAGAAFVCMTIVAMVIARIYMQGLRGRILAVGLTPWLWFSFVGVVCGLKGVCFVCFSAGGSVRQISSFELALPQISTKLQSIAKGVATASVTSLGHHGFSHNDGNPKSSTKENEKLEPPSEPFSPHSARASEFVIKPVTNSDNDSSTTSKAMVVKLWAPMVEVQDPLVIRAHWEAVVQGFLWSLLCAAPIGIIAAAI